MRRGLAYAVLLCLAGAGLALFAATRTWATEPAGPLSHADRTGGDLVPWLPPIALVGLAGAGALLATRRAARAAVGAVLVWCGAGVLAASAYAIVNGAGPGWPVAAALGGAALLAGGLLALVRGRRWPALGARYERRSTADPAGGTVAAWDALDRGDDPTVG